MPLFALWNEADGLPMALQGERRAHVQCTFEESLHDLIITGRCWVAYSGSVVRHTKEIG